MNTDTLNYIKIHGYMYNTNGMIHIFMNHLDDIKIVSNHLTNQQVPHVVCGTQITIG